MSKVEHDSALVRRVASAIYRPDNDGSAAAEARAAIDSVRAWDAEHAEPTVEALIEGIGELVTVWKAIGDEWRATAGSPYRSASGPTPRAALLALRDAVKGERHE